jgi:hypothetical protein
MLVVVEGLVNRLQVLGEQEEQEEVELVKVVVIPHQQVQ